MEYDWLDVANGAPTDPAGLVVTGWVLCDPRPADRPATRVVAVVGGRVVPCEQLRFRRPDIELRIGRRAAGAGFVVRVPSAELATGGSIRVFGVGTDGAVTELTGPGAAAPATPPAAP